MIAMLEWLARKPVWRSADAVADEFAQLHPYNACERPKAFYRNQTTLGSDEHETYLVDLVVSWRYENIMLSRSTNTIRFLTLRHYYRLYDLIANVEEHLKALKEAKRVSGKLSELVNKFFVDRCGITSRAATRHRTLASRTRDLFHAVGPRAVFECRYMGTSWILNTKASEWKEFINKSKA
jgi:hypothetical protein